MEAGASRARPPTRAPPLFFGAPALARNVEKGWPRTVTHMTQRQMHLVSRFGLVGALFAAAAVLPACAAEDTDADLGDEDVAEAASAIGETGGNNYPPYAVESDPLKGSVTRAFNLTSTTNPDPRELCAAGTVTSSGCALRAEWKSWMDADPTNRNPTMIAIAKCAVESSFTIHASSDSFAGQWGLYPGWKSNRLSGQDKRERVSSCMLSLLNGNNVELALCIIGPGGAPFNAPCTDPVITTREGGFFGDLFAETPTAYIAGPDAAQLVNSGRVCTSNSGTSYCCAESDTSCNHRIVLAGAILGDPNQNYANKRCNSLATAGSFQYCTSYFSTREPGRSYTNVFTSFVPPAQ